MNNMFKYRKIILPLILITIILMMNSCITATVGGSFYMVNYALKPTKNRADTALKFKQVCRHYPEVKSWMDSLRQHHAITDTFLYMSTGERHHAYVIRHTPNNTRRAVLIHGWRDQGMGMMMIARIYEKELGYDVLVPDLHAHGLSEGKRIGMGWKERKDVLEWMEHFKTDTMVVHGISMGAATTMNVSGEPMLVGIRSIKFVEDCGYTSVWDEFKHEMKSQFKLPPFPLLYGASIVCGMKDGWRFKKASPLKQVAKCPYPMLFIHGDKDRFVPFEMVHPLYNNKKGEKELWVTKGTVHAWSYHDYPEEYVARLRAFLGN